jgi:hypothetical protein
MGVWQYQANLNKGALDPKLKGRIDADVYYNGLETAKNVRLTPQGAAQIRPGTKYVDTVPANAVMREFKVTDSLFYTLVFVFEDAPATDPSRMYVYENNVLQTNINGSGNDWLDISPSGEWDGADIKDTFYYIQSTNTAIILAAGHKPAIIGRTNSTTWSFSTVTFTNVPQYDFNDASSPTPADEVQRIVFVNVNTSDRYKLSLDGFLSEDVVWSATTSENITRIARALQNMPNTASSGISVAYSTGTTYDITFGGNSAGSYGLVTAIAVDTQSTSFSGEATITTPGTSRKEDAFSATRGWPEVAVFHQSRLWMASTDSLPDSIFGSVIGDFYNFNIDQADDDDAVFVTLQTDQINKVYSLVSSRKLQVFTAGAEFYCPEDVITPSNVRFDVFSNYGSARVKPAVIDGAVVYPQNNSRALIRSNIVNQFQAIEARNIGVLAPHLLGSMGRVEIARGSATSDANYIYILNTEDSSIACLNYLPEEGVEGFSTWETEQGLIKDICVAGGMLNVIVNRNGVWTLEVEDSDYRVDCGLPVSSQTIDMSHINGESIEAIGDGFYMGTFTASSSTDLGREVTSGYAGIRFRPTVKTMPIVISLNNGPNAGRKKRIRRAILRLLDSNGVQVDGVDVPDLTIGSNQFSAPTPNSGIKRIPLRGYAIDKQIEVTQNTPYPFTLLSIGAEVKT